MHLLFCLSSPHINFYYSVSLLESCGKTLTPNKDSPARGTIVFKVRGTPALTNLKDGTTCELKMRTRNDNEALHFRLMV